FFGRRLVNMVGSGITKLNTGRAFCVTLATAVTVLGASHLGLPVSTTHVAVGGVFGVGFAREWLDRRRNRQAQAMPAEETQRRVLVRRSHVMTITLAWLVTLPITATLGALTRALALWATGV
ncbi:MAG: inorganic phosphate transporter, partial [Paracoccus sp. (in: a-proteobacteria)]